MIDSSIMDFYKWFFLAEGRKAEGLFSPAHLISVTITLAVFLTAAVLLAKKFKNDPKKQNLILILSGVFIVLVQIAQITFLVVEYRDTSLPFWQGFWQTVIGNAPLYLCDMQIFLIPLAAITRGRFRDWCLDFVAIWGLLMGFFGNYFAGNIYGGNPAFCFITLISLLNHSISAFTALFIIVSGLNKMRLKDIPFTVGILVVYMTVALVVDYVDEHNFMFFFRGDGTPFDLFLTLVKGNVIPYQIFIYLLQTGYMVAFSFAYVGIREAVKDARERDAEFFDPETNKYPYPEDTDKHYLNVKKDNHVAIDEHYPYVDNSFGFKFKRFWIRVLLFLIVFPLTHIRLGLKIKGKENLKKNKELIKNGVVSCSNHVHMWDYLCIMNALKPKKTNILAWAPNIRGENGPLMRLVGGIPIPENNLKATMVMFDSIKQLLDNGGWLHIYPEGSMWEYYSPIRPFKKGASYFAVENDKPIIPLGFSYRKPNWFRRKIFGQIACFTLTIGEPLFPNKELAKTDRELDLTTRAHDAVCKLARIDPKDNIYAPIYNHSKRIDYYTDEYGVGYKGSW